MMLTGQVVLTGPVRAALTAAALRSVGTVQNHHFLGRQQGRTSQAQRMLGHVIELAESPVEPHHHRKEHDGEDFVVAQPAPTRRA